MSLKNSIEAILFVASRPLTIKQLAGILETEETEVSDAVDALLSEYNVRQGGVQILRHGKELQFVTAAECGAVVQTFLKAETSGELTRPALETLSIIAYRGPIMKSDLEKIRGVNCSLILRNLMMRGLVIAEEDKRRLVTYYAVSSDFVRHLGLTSIQDLPEYISLHNPEVVERLLAEDNEQQPANEAAEHVT
ncbi:MAG: SMC-Scp complex subunit ScpB [Patescibacteria group bacterium]|jgi:segregation and condensation protein B